MTRTIKLGSCSLHLAVVGLALVCLETVCSLGKWLDTPLDSILLTGLHVKFRSFYSKQTSLLFDLDTSFYFTASVLVIVGFIGCKTIQSLE